MLLCSNVLNFVLFYIVIFVLLNPADKEMLQHKNKNSGLLC